MMAETPPLLHELLKEDQEPFHLKTNKQSHLKLTNLIFRKTSTNLCFAASPAQSPIQIQPKSRAGLGLLGSFLKRLKDRSKKRKRAIEVIKIPEENYSEKDKSASTSSRFSEFCLGDDTTPFTFSFHQSPSSTGRRTPEFDSPCRHIKQEKENSDNNQGDEKEEKEQCSPVSVLDPPFDVDDECESGRANGEEEEDEEDYDMECSYTNVQRAKQQLMQRLRRFETLAELDPVELELEGSDDEVHVEREGDEPLSADMKRLVSDLIEEEKTQMVQSGDSEVVMGRMCNRLDSWKEVEFDTIDMMIGLDLKKEFDGWSKHGQQVHETTLEIEVAIYLLLIQEITEELLI